MGIPDNSLRDLIEKVRSWISWGGSDLSCLSSEFEMPNNGCKMCCECDTSFTELRLRYHCQSCGRVFCGRCTQGYESAVVDELDVVGNTNGAGGNIKSCRFCSEVIIRRDSERRHSGKIYPSTSPWQSPEPPSPSSIGGRTDMHSEQIQSDRLARILDAQEHVYSPHAVTGSSVTSFSSHPSPVSVRGSSSRSDEEEAEYSVKHFFSSSSEYCQDILDIDSCSFSRSHEFYSFKSVGSSPSDSPSRINFTSDGAGHSVQQETLGSLKLQNDGPFDQETMAVLRRPETGTEDLENY
ncbi:hypothetical protein L1049_007197 [Liquidambar formosana]|uniref:FYVE-type domain-containing protein n=1 Tax=Liquidambar formosana TaxID=63359 RepID=A0AAP0RK88_LIQFO